MSAAIASRRRPSRMASAMYGSSSTINTRMCRCYEQRISRMYAKPHTCWQRRAALTGGMAYSEPARTIYRTRLRWNRVVGLLVVIVAIATGIGYHSRPSSSSPAAAPRHIPHTEQHGALAAADGAVPNGTTVFDDDVPGVAKLSPDLRGALHRAATAAADDGVEFFVDSGWRSAAYQQHLLDEAVSKYGSKAAAARWVATPKTSTHVSGGAVDIGRSNAVAWLSVHGAQYGLCQIYANERWHYELRPEAIDQGCPPMYADPTHDPRMQR